MLFLSGKKLISPRSLLPECSCCCEVVSCKRYNQRTIEAIQPQDSHQSIAPPTDVHCLSGRTVWLRPSPAPPTLAYLMAIGYHESLSIEDTSPVGMAVVDSFHVFIVRDRFWSSGE
ncbi:hypothetical protein TNCT_630601 [Trichonephila clavata]|uniref:Uncharacterized protein n=1 Tax=Trichonephila clavata TaxID=2740835 RepID=A0A8X6JLX9_TRICU|nr:hypothetical protein TNCT_630601 [Trichonephila clavata]